MPSSSAPERLRRYALCIFDADDTLRRTTVPGRPCPRAAGEWELLPGIADALRPIRWNAPGEPCLGLVSNQDQVGYGHLAEETARSLLRDLARAAAGATPEDEALQLCPHLPGDQCRCRKPRPGMLLRIMAHYRVEPGRTLFVGDSESDRLAAAAAGTDFAWAAEVFSSSAEPSGHRIRRTPRPAAVDSCGGAGGRRIPE